MACREAKMVTNSNDMIFSSYDGEVGSCDKVPFKLYFISHVAFFPLQVVFKR